MPQDPRPACLTGGEITFGHEVDEGVVICVDRSRRDDTEQLGAPFSESTYEKQKFFIVSRPLKWKRSNGKKARRNRSSGKKSG